MLETHNIRISYLKHLLREPSELEILNVQSSFNTIEELEKLILDSQEYKTTHDLFSYDYQFDNDNNIYTISNFTAEYNKGFSLTNGVVGMETNTHYNKSTNVYVKDANNTYDAFAFNDVSFTFSNNEVLTSLNHTQTLHMNDCKFIDILTLDNRLNVTVEKYPLHTYQSCFLQKITLSSTNEENVTMYHNFEEALEFNTYTIPLNNIFENFSQLKGEEVTLTNVYSFQEHNVEYQGYTVGDKVIKNKFTLKVMANIPYVLYIISCSTINSHGVNINEYLQNIRLHTYGEVIGNHTIAWNKKWNTKLNITNKETLSHNDVLVPRMNFLIKNALFNIYSNVHSTDYMFHVPILILLKPTLAKVALNHLIKTNDSNLSTFSGSGVFKSSLLSIHVWNYFRTSKDKHWLQNTGFPAMQKIADFIADFLTDNSVKFTTALNKDSQNNNVLTNYMASMALQYTNQAIYELNYLYIDKYKLLADSLIIQYITQDVQVPVSDTNLSIRLGEKDDLFHYDFYDSQNNNLGYQFGGDSGHKLSLLSNTVYDFTVDESLVNHPIKFVSSNNIDILISSNISINSDKLKGYAFFSECNFHSTFKEHFNHTYGTNAFISHSLDNVVLPYDNYNFEMMEYAEPLLMFNSYYNNKLSKLPNFMDTIKDNISYYSNYSSNNNHNTILEAGLHGLVSQYESRYVNKRSHINLFYNKLLPTIDTNEPWSDGVFSLMTLFVIVTCLFELTPQGETTKDRIMTKSYGMKYTTRNVLPDPFKQMTITNTGTNDRLCTINNSVYVDAPFNASIEGIRYSILLDDSAHTMTINPDFGMIFPTGLPSDTEYKLLMDTFVPTTSNEVDGIVEQTYRTLEDVRTNPMASSSNIVISYTPLINTIESTEPVLIDEFHNKIVYLYVNSGGAEKLTHTEYKLLTDTTTQSTNPTVSATLSFESSDVLHMDMVFNSQDQTYYDIFSNLAINISYDNFVIDPNITYTFAGTHSMSNHIDESRVSIQITTATPIASTNYDVGRLTFLLNENNMKNISQTMVPISGTVLSSKEKNIVITNGHIFPPLVHTIDNMPVDFVFPPTMMSDAYIPSDQSYFPITDVTISSGFALDSQGEINTFLQQSDKHIYDIVGNTGNIIFTTRNNTNNTQKEYYGIGNNSNNVLMLTNVGLNEAITPTRCQLLEDYMTSKAAQVKEMVKTNSFVMILDSQNNVHGVGYNESYNIGNGTNVNTNTLSESTLINNLSGTITHIVVNDKATLIVTDSTMVYGLGESLMFNYLVEIVDPPMDTPLVLETPTVITSINTFLQSNNYTIVRVDSGLQHFKFLLMNNNGDTEWWGVGNNQYNSMGVGAYIDYDFNIKYMTRLHQIERFIHAKEYDASYTGPKASSPTNYHLMRSKGSSTSFTSIVDVATKDVYVIGTMDAGGTIYDDWTKPFASASLESLNHQYYTQTEDGVVIGGSDLPITYL
uniref:Glycosyl hydrolase family 95 catalytic domain-containing protein n=1 Tax=Pyramimonas orientalis virus TaxID=455367 RepID=A0A7L9AXT1_POV01|nr:hypothetical protein HWQ62_00303 [Pyramimonas orientalis virus]